MGRLAIVLSCIALVTIAICGFWFLETPPPADTGAPGLDDNLPRERPLQNAPGLQNFQFPGVGSNPTDQGSGPATPTHKHPEKTTSTRQPPEYPNKKAVKDSYPYDDLPVPTGDIPTGVHDSWLKGDPSPKHGKHAATLVKRFTNEGPSTTKDKAPCMVPDAGPGAYTGDCDGAVANGGSVSVSPNAWSAIGGPTKDRKDSLLPPPINAPKETTTAPLTKPVDYSSPPKTMVKSKKKNLVSAAAHLASLLAIPSTTVRGEKLSAESTAAHRQFEVLTARIEKHAAKIQAARGVGAWGNTGNFANPAKSEALIRSALSLLSLKFFKFDAYHGVEKDYPGFASEEMKQLEENRARYAKEINKRKESWCHAKRADMDAQTQQREAKNSFHALLKRKLHAPRSTSWKEVMTLVKRGAHQDLASKRMRLRRGTRMGHKDMRFDRPGIGFDQKLKNVLGDSWSTYQRRKKSHKAAAHARKKTDMRCVEARAEFKAVLKIESETMHDNCITTMEEVQGVENARHAGNKGMRMRDQVDVAMGVVRCHLDNSEAAAAIECAQNVRKGKHKTFDARMLCPAKADMLQHWGPADWTPSSATCRNM
jgi:hypothetical protein